MSTNGKVTFVGGGCGDPRLLTARACEVLAVADFVLFDPEVHPDVLARLPDGTPRHPVTAMMSPERIGQMLALEARQGRHAVRITWGDPLLFSAGDVEGIAVAKHGIALEVVPGVTPFTAIGAFAGVPLTRSSDVSPSVAVLQVTRGHESLHDWEKLATATDTLAILCDAETVAETARSLVFYGRKPTDHVTLIENASLPEQRVTESTLGQVPLLPRANAARVVMAVGVHSMQIEDLTWFESRPLFSKRVLVTRAREQASATAALLRDLGADAVLMPTIEIHAPSDPGPMIDALGALERYKWVVFTSANGVERTWAELRRQGRDARAFGRAKVAAIGPGTAAALERCGLAADLVAKDHKGEGLATDLTAAIGTDAPRVLVARAEVARDVVPDALRQAGCTVDVVAVYKTRSPPRPLLEGLSALLEGGEIDIVTFTSSSTVEHLCDALDARAPELLAKTCVASIGPITSETAKKRGLRVDVTAEDHTVPGLVRDIERWFSKRD
jgi:uroporphyrinogen III methyltransferase/synthase